MTTQICTICALCVLLHLSYGCDIQSLTQKSEVVAFEGVVINKGSKIVCESDGRADITRSWGWGKELISTLDDDVALVSVECETWGAIACSVPSTTPSSEKSEQCLVYLTGLRDLDFSNCGNAVLMNNQNYLIYAVPDERYQQCAGVYKAEATVMKKEPSQKDVNGKCVQSQGNQVVQEQRRRLLQDSQADGTQSNVTKAQCGLFGVDLTYCAPEGLVTDRQSAKVVLACDNPITGICADCLRIEGPQSGVIDYVASVKDVGTHHEIKFSWEQDYLGPVTLSTDECDLIDTKQKTMLDLLVPIKFSRMESVLVRPSGYKIN